MPEGYDVALHFARQYWSWYKKTNKNEYKKLSEKHYNQAKQILKDNNIYFPIDEIK